jgi:hypothetical protein
MEHVFVRVNWDKTAPEFRMPGTRWFDLHVGPEPGWPFGRKGLALDGAWRQLRSRGCAGMLVLDGDVAVDPLDYAAMGGAIHADPRAVHVGPVRLWPASTMRESWAWGHWRTGAGPGQEWCEEPDRWTFGFTFLPRRLLHAAGREGLRDWAFPGVDLRMAATAKKWGIPARVVPGCYPKHMHY